MSKGKRRSAANNLGSDLLSARQKSGARVSVVVSILSLLVAMTSLGVAFVNSLHQQREELLVSLDSLGPEVFIGKQDLPSSSFGGLLYARRSCLLANIGDRSLAVTSIETYVDVREGYRVTPAQALFEPISLAPGEAKRVEVNLHYPVGKKAIEVLARENLLAQGTDRFKVISALAQAGIDLQDEPVKPVKLDAAGAVHMEDSDRGRFTHCVNVHTAKGEVFSNCVRFYPG